MRAVVLVSLFLAACVIGDGEDELGHDEASDYEVQPDDGKGDGVSAVFDQNNVVSDDLFIDDGEMSVTEVQHFFEHSPYKNRSWLADFKVNGISAAQAVVNAARQEGIHPMMLLTRMQVEATLVSKTVRPSNYRIDHALGCGCPDGSGCAATYRGFDRQLQCGAKVLRKGYDGSLDGTAAWRIQRPGKTLDPKTVTPANHATASLYAYTPWVLLNRGGNWLIWNVARKYVRHAEAAGYLD